MTAAGAEAGRLRAGRPMNAGELRGWATELRKLAAHVEDSGGRDLPAGGQEMTAEAATALTQCRYRASVGNHV